MNNTRREIECLSRLQATTQQLDQILFFLKQENLIDDNRVKSTRQSADHAKEIQLILRELQTKQRLQLLEYEWTLLPVENIKISIVTDRNQAEFVFNS